MTATSIADLLPARRIIPRLRARNKRHALRALAKCLAGDVPTAKDAIMGAVSACADYPAFGPGTGVALLHAVVPGLEKPLAAAARLDPALNFGALDGSSTDILVLLLSPPSDANLHLRALACLARRLRREDVRRHLRGAEDPASMYVVIAGDEIGAPESVDLVIVLAPPVRTAGAAELELSSKNPVREIGGRSFDKVNSLTKRE
jgi:PTS system nitrogen regulatory IIA component